MSNQDQANNEEQRKPTSPKIPVKPENSTKDSSPLDTKFEAFILGQFAKMPLAVRVLVYLLLVLVYIFNAVQDPMLMGEMYVQKRGESVEIPAVGYELVSQGGSVGFKTNNDGRWILKAPHRLVPIGKIRVEIREPINRGSLGHVDLCPPPPILGQFRGGVQYRLSYRENTAAPLSVVPECSAVGVASASGKNVAYLVAQRGEVTGFRITINRIMLHNTDHQRSTAEVYFIVRQGERVVPTPSVSSIFD